MVFEVALHFEPLLHTKRVASRRLIGQFTAEPIGEDVVAAEGNLSNHMPVAGCATESGMTSRMYQWPFARAPKRSRRIPRVSVDFGQAVTAPTTGWASCIRCS